MHRSENRICADCIAAPDPKWPQILESAISMTFSGRAASAKSCRINLSLNISSVGLFPVNISIKMMPRLYTSPKHIKVTWSNVPDRASYSDGAIGIHGSSTCSFIENPSNAKISNSSPHILSKKNVTWLEITVDDRWLATIMKII